MNTVKYRSIAALLVAALLTRFVSPPLVQSGEAKVEFDVPRGTKAFFQGQEVPIDTPLVINDPKPWAPYVLRLVPNDGAQIYRQLYLSSSETVRVALPSFGPGFTRMMLQSGHAATIKSIDVSSDGRTLLTASADHTAILWRLSDERQLMAFSAHGQPTTAAAISPVQPGVAITGGQDGRAFVWDLVENRTIGEPLDHSNFIHRIRYSKRGDKVLTVVGGDPHRGGEGAAILWSLRDASRLQKFTDGLYGIFWADISPDETRVVGASYQQTLAWDASTGKVLRTWPRTRFVYFDATGKILITDAGILPIESDEITVPFDYDGSPNSSALSVDKTLYAIGTTDEVHIWSIPSGQRKCRIKQPGTIDAISFSPDAKTIFIASGGTTSQSSTITQWDLTRAEPGPMGVFGERSRKGRPDPILSIRCEGRSIRIATSSESGSGLTHWTHGETTRKSTAPFSDFVSHAHFSDSDSQMAVGTSSKHSRGYLREWSPSTNQARVLFHEPRGKILLVDKSEDGRSLAIATENSLTWISADDPKHNKTIEFDRSERIAISCGNAGAMVARTTEQGAVSVEQIGASPKSWSIPTKDRTVVSIDCSIAHSTVLIAAAELTPGRKLQFHVDCWSTESVAPKWSRSFDVPCTLVVLDKKCRQAIIGLANGTFHCVGIRDGVETHKLQTPGCADQRQEQFAYDDRAQPMAVDVSVDGATGRAAIAISPARFEPGDSVIEVWDTRPSVRRINVIKSPVAPRAITILPGTSQAMVLGSPLDTTSIRSFRSPSQFGAIIDLLNGQILETPTADHFVDARNLVLFTHGRSGIVSTNGGELLWTDRKGVKGKPLATPEVQTFARPIGALERSPGNKYVAAGFHESLLIWCTSTWRLVNQLEHRETVEHCAIAPSETEALATTNDEAFLWDITRSRLLSQRTLHTGRIIAAVYVKGKPCVLTNDDGSGRVRLWSVEDGRLIRELESARGSVRVCRAADRGDLICLSFVGGRTGIWDASTGQLTSSIHESMPRKYPRESPTFANSIQSASFSNDGSRVAIVHGGTDWLVKEGRYRTTEELISGGQVAVWNLEKRAMEFVIPTVSGDQVIKSAVIADDGSTLVTAGSGSAALSQWDIATTKRIRTLALENSGENCEQVLYSSHGRFVTAGGGDRRSGSLTMIDAATGICRGAPIPHFLGVRHVCINAVGNRVASVDDIGDVRVFDLNSRNQIGMIRAGADRATLSRDGNTVLSVRRDQAMIWSLKTQKRLATMGGTATWPRSGCAVLSPDESSVLVGCGGQFDRGPRFTAELRLFRARTGELIKELQGVSTHDLAGFSGHHFAVTAVAFDHSGTLVASGAEDGEILVWHAERGEVLRKYEGHNGPVAHLEFSGNNRYLVSAAADSSVRIWDLADGTEQLRLFSFNKGTEWASVSPNGMFDGSIAGREAVCFSTSRNGELQSNRMEDFFSALYRVGLTTRILAGERPVARDQSGDSHRPPDLQIVKHEVRKTAENIEVIAKIDVVDKGGGAQEPAVFLGDSMQRWPVKGVTTRLNKSTVRWTFVLPYLHGNSRLEVRSARHDGLWASDPAISYVTEERIESPPEHLRALCIGAKLPSDDDTMAPSSAKAIATVLERFRHSKYKGVSSTVLSSGDFANEPTRTRILSELSLLSEKTNPSDTLVIYICGHGSRDSQRYYLQLPVTQDEGERAGRMYVDEIGEAVGNIPCARRLIILDTCYAGAGARQSELFAYRRAVESTGRETGVFTLASVSRRLSWGAPELGITNLAIALQCVSKQQITPGIPQDLLQSPVSGSVDVRAWCDVAGQNVPRIEKMLGFRLPSSVVVSGNGKSFLLLESSADAASK